MYVHLIVFPFQILNSNRTSTIFVYSSQATRKTINDLFQHLLGFIYLRCSYKLYLSKMIIYLSKKKKEDVHKLSNPNKLGLLISARLFGLLS